MATPIATTPAAPVISPRSGDGTNGDRRLRLEDVLKLMVADGLVLATDADRLARSRTRRFEHPLEMVADQKWKSQAPPHKTLTLEWLVEWLAGKLGVPYRHIVPAAAELPP